MQVVIQTQVRENYGTESAPHWKFKGGSVYTVRNLTAKQVAQVNEKGIPTLKALIENFNPMCEEYIVGFDVVADDAEICDKWETPTVLSWVGGRWVASQVTENDEYGYMRHEILRKIESWDMLMGGDRENYKATFIMREDGRAVDYEGLTQLLAA